MFIWLVRILLWLPAKIIFPTIVIGRKNLKNKKCVMVCNHQSVLDPFLFLINTNIMFHTLSKSEIFKNPISKWVFTHLNCIPVNRKENDLSAIKSSLRVLKENKRLLIFPAGTRSEEGKDFENFKNGASLIAHKSGASVIPLAYNKKPKAFRLTKIYVGEPINFELPEDLKGNELYSEMTNQIEKNMNSLVKNRR